MEQIVSLYFAVVIIINHFIFNFKTLHI